MNALGVLKSKMQDLQEKLNESNKETDIWRSKFEEEKKTRERVTWVIMWATLYNMKYDIDISLVPYG